MSSRGRLAEPRHSEGALGRRGDKNLGSPWVRNHLRAQGEPRFFQSCQ
jgi:hypothetical protein